MLVSESRGFVSESRVLISESRCVVLESRVLVTELWFPNLGCGIAHGFRIGV